MDDNILANPGLMDPSTEFGNMMQTAMKIKGHQMEQDRRKFETWPQFFQNSLWMKGPPLELRPLPPAERLSGATALKEKGNELFKAKKFGLAVEQYESALGCFKWAKQLDADWKSKGIRDETIEVCEEFGEGKTREAVVALMVSCYNNLAACYLGRARARSAEPGCTIEGDCALCTQACDAALELDRACAKALYRRACARTEPVSAGASAIDAAIKDLAEAARHSPEDKAVRSMLAKLRKTRAEQREKDTATYSGLFGRGEIYDAKSLRAQKEREAKEVGKAKATEKARTPEDCEREAKEAEAVVEHLREQGKLDEAAQLSSKIAEHRKQLDEYRQLEESGQGSDRPDHIDFRNPTDEQLRDAQKHGIDLRDPMVVAELERLQNEKVAEDGEVGDADGGGGWAGEGASSARERRAMRRRRRPPPPDVHGMPLWEIKRRLDEMAVDYDDIESDRPALEDRLMAQYSFDRQRDVELDQEEYYEDYEPQSWSSWAWGYCSIL